MSRSIEELDILWEQLADVVIDDRDLSEESFMHFPTGTCKFGIWTWFEEQNDSFIVGKKLYPNR